jgi:hypothetical protein
VPLRRAAIAVAVSGQHRIASSVLRYGASPLRSYGGKEIDHHSVTTMDYIASFWSEACARRPLPARSYFASMICAGFSRPRELPLTDDVLFDNEYRAKRG